MIAEVVLHVWKVRQKYDPAKARESTWLQHVTDNKCRTILSHYNTRQFTACETGALSDEVANHVRTPSRTELGEAKSAVERVIEFGSDSVLDFLDKLFNGGLITEVPAYELRQTAKRCKASLHDFELVYRLATGV